MLLRSTIRWAATAAFVLAATGSATAQPGAAPAADAQVGFERKPQVAPAEQLKQADAILVRMDQASGTVRRQLEQARSARDVVKTLCLNDKLSQIDVAARSGRDRQAALQAAVQRSDAELSGHEFTVLTVLRQRADQLSAEANQCIGEEVSFVGQTQVSTSIDPNIPNTDTTPYPPPDPTLIANPPACVSCNGQ